MPDFIQILIAVVAGSTVTVPAILWLLSKWLGTRIDASIKHEYDMRKSDYDQEHKRRERTQLIAELLAEWMASAPSRPMTTEQRTRLNRLSFEATLWLPESIAIELSRVLQRDPSATNQFQVLLNAREILSGPHSLTTKHVTQWGFQKELPNNGLPDGCTSGQLVVLSVSEEIAGRVAAIPHETLKNGFKPTRNSNLSFVLIRNGDEVTVTTSNLESIQLVRAKYVSGVVEEMTLQLHPEEFANDIIRSISKAAPGLKAIRVNMQ